MLWHQVWYNDLDFLLLTYAYSELFNISKQFIRRIDSHIDVNACVLPLGNGIFVFGGSTDPNQVSYIYSWGIKLFDTLPFKFENGVCQYHDGEVFLCFANPSNKQCHRWSGNIKWTKLQKNFL